eukprot:CAMPEP_0178969538 /NCGR_PEP_ID=MMETSP0789-20121207/18925_1 /TAXON_ID=3005 /ORGANISM="Rhizosolenia setigera, Strain CCMP 1694" /LENGTH=882 /DNA_ID=CAMNT_0020655709 /DNA_START=196 /DNA_END=2844 /DNA_ORIENTATION=-
MADQNPKTNTLDKNKFFNAIRLIQLYQNGQRPSGATLEVGPQVTLKPPYFEGIPPPGTAASAAGAVPPTPIPPPSPTPNNGNTYQNQPMQQSRPHLGSQASQRSIAAPLQQQPQPPPPQSPQREIPGPNNALTAHQDPYTMLPHERSRYDELFPNYEKLKDGFVYGPEAVALFSRSGLSKEQLRDVWNLSDNPVDNRLDKLEFAIAMHLIVCVSRKNLELPKQLPNSLQSLKDNKNNVIQQVPTQDPTPPTMATAAAATTFSSPAPVSAPSGNFIPSPEPVVQAPQMVPPSPQRNNSMYGAQPSSGAAAAQPAPNTEMNGMNQMQNGFQMNQTMNPAMRSMSISDAFDEVNMPKPNYENSMGDSSGMNPPSLGAGPGAATNAPLPSLQGVTEITAPQPTLTSTEPPKPPAVTSLPVLQKPTEPDYTVTETKNNTPAVDQKETGDSGELQNLQKVLQQLRAENISLNAKLGSLADEDIETRKEIADTVAEIGSLSKELVGLREKVASAKANLIESTSELKFLKEKKSDLTESIADAQETAQVLNEANERVQAMKEEATTAANQPAPVVNQADFFGFDEQPPAPTTGANMNEVQNQVINNPHPSQTSMASSASNSMYTPNDVVNTNGTHEHASMPGPPAPSSAAGPVINYDNQYMGVDAHAAQQTLYMGGVAHPGMTNPMIDPNQFGHGHNVSQPGMTKEEKSKMDEEALKATEVVNELEEQQQVAYQQAEELQEAAREADQRVHELRAATSKKKGLLKGGNKKAQKKELESALADAEQKRKKCQDVQETIVTLQQNIAKARLNAEAIHTKNKQAEYELAAAASTNDTQNGGVVDPNNVYQNHQHNMYGNGNGYTNNGHMMGGHPTSSNPNQGNDPFAGWAGAY